MSYDVFVASRSYGKYSSKTKKILEENNCRLKYNTLDRVYKEKDLLKVIENYDVIVVGVDEVSKKVINKAEKLKVIAKNGVGVDNIDLESANKKGIYVINAPGTNSDSVADLAVALMLSISRSIPAINNITKKGKWQRIIGRELWNKTVGIIGTGDIGQKLIHRIKKGFNCEILAFDINRRNEIIKKYGVNYVQIEKLFSDSDFISLHLPLNDKTRNLVNKERLDLMKKSAYLINTARGGVVNEDDLYWALKNNEIAGAACDVYSEEPPGKNKLFELDNFIATSHIGAFTYETNERTGLSLAKNIIKALNGETPDNLVNSPFN